MDADVLFINFNTRIEDVLARWGKNKALLVREQITPAPIINTGVFLVQNRGAGVATMGNLRAACPEYKDHALPERDVLTHDAFGLPPSVTLPTDIYALVPQMRADVAAVSQRSSNTNLIASGEGPAAATWQHCDYVGHILGPGGGARARLIRNMGPRIEICTEAADWTGL